MMKKLLTTLLLIGMTNSNLVADIQAGKAVYQANCAICHTINGGRALGPDFNIVAYTRHPEEIEAYAKDPYSNYQAFGYAANAMPTLPLSDQEFKDVAQYISSLQPFKKWMIKKSPKKPTMQSGEENATQTSDINSSVKRES